MKLRYLGPRQSVGVGGFGLHIAGEVRDYPEEFAFELLRTSVRQRFELVPEAPASPKPSSKPKSRRRIKP